MPDYQVIVNMVANVLFISFPIALVFMICQKIIGSFTGVVFGKDITF